MKLFIDVSPGFYKTKLFNELYRRIDIFVVYTSDYDNSSRNEDFLGGERHYKYTCLSGNKINQWLRILYFIFKYKSAEKIVGGYTSFSSWVPILFSKKRHNSVIVESTYRETKVSGYQVYLKRFFFSRVSKAYVCGTPHEKLTKLFGFKGKTVIWNSVGLINRAQNPTFEERMIVKRFLFVGRLIPVKNLPWLIERFSNHLDLELSIIGFGEESDYLKSIVKTPNIHFIGAVNNTELSYYYHKSDVFILPSLSETWGLVIEEALNNGLPVMVSDMVGCADDLVIRNEVGVVYKVNDILDFEDKLEYICNVKNNNVMRGRICEINFEEREKSIISAFLE